MNNEGTMNGKSIAPMLVVGTLAQLAMIGAGHYSPFVRDSVFAIGGMLISLIFGAAWAATGATTKSGGMKGGALVGGGCALIGIAASVALGDTEAMVLSFGTLSSAVTGAIGGLLGHVMIASKRCGQTAA
ncbi:MAG: hypothetical protein IPK83_04850 [Planctomycetes bacterium]|nr:hypothetical protein [Planctomycetota bacterium]